MTRLLFATVLAALTLIVTPQSHAQLAIGGQVGDPTGLSLKAGVGRGAVAIAVGWDLDDSVSAEMHYLLRDNRPRGTSNDVRVFYGPGVYVKAHESRDAILGVSIGAGLGIMVAREIEVYGILSPRLQLVNRTDFDIGGGIGARLTL